MANKGFTLYELVVALAIWMVLSLSIFFVWQHVSVSTFSILESQNALENARVSMDVLIVNIQMARSIYLQVDANNIMEMLVLSSYEPGGGLYEYVFAFDVNAPYTAARFQVLRFGANEIADGIARIYMEYVPGPSRRINIAVHTACEIPIVLTSAVDVRFKSVVLL